MKKLMLTLLAFLTIGFASAQNSITCPAGPDYYPDVPAGHWAAQAVDRLSDLGIIIGFPDGYYRGNENLTRYQAALMFYRLLECYMGSGWVDQDSFAALRSAVAELTARVDSNSAIGAENRRLIDAMQRQIASMGSGSGNLQPYASQIAANTASSSANASSAAANSSAIASNSSAIASNSSAITSNTAEIDTLKRHSHGNTGGADLSGYTTQISANAAAIEALKRRPSGGGTIDLSGYAAQISSNTTRGESNSAQISANAVAIEALKRQPSGGGTVDLSGYAAQISSNTTRGESNSARISANEASIAALSSQVVSNTTRIDALERRIGGLSGGSGVDERVIADLQNQLSALRVKADTAQARADEAYRIANSYTAPDLTAILNRLDQHDRSIATLNNVVSRLNQQIAEIDLSGIERNTRDIANIREFAILLRRNQTDLQGRVTALEEGLSGYATAADLNARLQAIEDKLFTFDGSITLDYDVIRHHNWTGGDLQDKLDGGGSGVLMGYDIDRIFGYGFDRMLPQEEWNDTLSAGLSYFNSGTDDDNDEDYDDLADLSKPKAGQVVPDVDVSFGFEAGNNGCNDGKWGSKGEKLDCFVGVITLSLEKVGVKSTDSSGDTITSTLVDGDGDALDFPYLFNFDGAQFHYNGIGNTPLTFEFGKDLDRNFTHYVFRTGEAGLKDGFAVDIGAPDFLNFLDPTIQFVYATDPDNEGTTGEDFSNADESYPQGTDATEDALNDETYAWGIRGTLSPFAGLTGGISFAQRANMAGEHANTYGNNITQTVFGVDGKISGLLGLFSAQFEYAYEDYYRETPQNDFDVCPDRSYGATESGGTVTSIDGEAYNSGVECDGQIFYILAQADDIKNIVPVLRDFDIAYRYIDPFWDGITTWSDADQVFDRNQAGFGLRAEWELFIFDGHFFFDTYQVDNGLNTVAGDDDNYAIDDTTTTAFGFEDVDIRVPGLDSLSVTGFFRQVSMDENLAVNNVSGVVDSNQTGRLEGDNATFVNSVNNVPVSTVRDDAYFSNEDVYETGFGIGVKHDGDRAGAFIPGLDAEFLYQRIHAGFDTTVIDFGADYDLQLAFLSFTPYIGYVSYSDPDVDPVTDGIYDNSYDGINYGDYTEFTAGTGVSTGELDVAFRPSFAAAVNYKSQSFRNGSPGRGVARTTTNDADRNTLQFAVAASLNRFLFDYSVLTAKYGVWDRSIDYLNNGATTKIDRTENRSGYEIIWNYHDLELAYGVFTADPNTADATDSAGIAQAFSIQYKVKF